MEGSLVGESVRPAAYPATGQEANVGGSSAPGPVVGRLEVLKVRPDLDKAWEVADALFPVRVTRSFWDRIDPSDPEDPLARQVLPDLAEAADPDGLLDPVGDQARSPLPWVIHKYPNRVLLLLTKRCHLYCRYCFRRTFDPAEREDPSPEELAAALHYARSSGAQEVILSGGDPLTLRDSALEHVFAGLRPQVPRLRVHTRAPITRPDRITPEFVTMLSRHRPVWVVVHCNHPRELSADVVQALDRLATAGIPVLNQAVLLRGVNDRVEVLAALSEALLRAGVRPYYLHATDRVRGAAHMVVPPAEGLALWQALRQTVSGPGLPRYVIDPPDGTGKMDVEAWLAGHRR
jgi:lysine 2,3-aminomutase